MRGKQIRIILFYLLAIISARFHYAGCYTLAPAIFIALYLEKDRINRKILLLASVWGLVLFLPITDSVRYIITVLASGILIKVVELIWKHCRSWWAGITGGAALFAIGAGGALMATKWQQNVAMNGFEGVLLMALVVLLNPVCHWILEWEPEKKAERQAEHAYTGKLAEYASAYETLSHTFNQSTEDTSKLSSEDVGRMQSEVTGKICLGCDMAGACLQREENPVLSNLMEVLQALVHKHDDYEDAAMEVASQCVHGQEMLGEAMKVFEKAQLNRAWYLRMMENREAIAQQLDSMAYAMKDCALEFEEIGPEHKNLVRSAEYRLRERGVVVSDMRLYRNSKNRMMLSAVLCAPKGRSVSVKDCAKDVSWGLRETMIPERDARTFLSKEPVEVQFQEEPVFKVISGVKKKPRDGAGVSGDNFTKMELADGTMVTGISDGMGCGAQASKESELVLELLEKFLEAGFDNEIALKMMNSAMVLHGENDQYSTVDLCCTDLYSGVSRFYKVGAASSYILHGREVTRIDDSSLPAGASVPMQIDSETKKLYHGDYIIQVSDGALDYLKVQDPEETMGMIIESTKPGNPERMASDIMDRVMLHTAGHAPDDITIMVSGIWER